MCMECLWRLEEGSRFPGTGAKRVMSYLIDLVEIKPKSSCKSSTFSHRSIPPMVSEGPFHRLLAPCAQTDYHGKGRMIQTTSACFMDNQETGRKDGVEERTRLRPSYRDTSPVMYFSLSGPQACCHYHTEL